LPLTGYPPEVLKTVYEDPTTTAMALVWKKFLLAPAAIASTETYRFDLVNIARQTLSGMSANYVKDIRHAWQAKDLKAYQHAAARYLELVSDLDRLLATRKEFSSGSWFNDAERWGDNDSERSRMEWNARRIISRWGTGTRLRDYAWKEWSGMLNGFYARRWAILFDYQEKALENKTAFDSKACDAAIREFEDNWSNAHEAYSSKPEGDSKSIAGELYRKYIGGSDNAYKK
jgi:alpha-N-acetylglucosaminidase